MLVDQLVIETVKGELAGPSGEVIEGFSGEEMAKAKSGGPVIDEVEELPQLDTGKYTNPVMEGGQEGSLGIGRNLEDAPTIKYMDGEGASTAAEWKGGSPEISEIEKFAGKEMAGTDGSLPVAEKPSVVQHIADGKIPATSMGEAGIEGGTKPIKVGKTDLDELRSRLGVPETDTIAVGKTNVKGLEGLTFEGQSPKVRSEAGLPDLDEIWTGRNIKSPGNNPLFTRHAEEVLANEFDRAVIEAGINPQDVSGVLKIHQSNPTGVCRKCIQGLTNDNVSPGVLKQLSLKYPNLRIEVTSEILPDVKVTGRSNFVIQNGQYVK